MKQFDEATWRSLSAAHYEQVARWSVPFRARRRIGKSHPVNDFLFVYYQYSSKKLERWHPGVGVELQGAKVEDFGQSKYSYTANIAFCDPAKMDEKEAIRLQWTVDLLKRTAERRGNFSCLGLHEWAMVYKGDEVRHGETTPFRLPQTEIDALVESRPITCSHFDAHRFFAKPALPLNRLQPTMDSRIELEQPACIHANMDLYKWAFKAMPWIGSDILLRCFDLAIYARTIDMRASPYDLAKYDDYEPIRIETAAGRAEYERLQREVADRAVPLRTELIGLIENVLQYQTPVQ